MCPQTDELKRLEGLAALAMLRKTAMAAELASGASVPDAARLLLPHEKKAKVRFSEIFQLMDSTTQRILAEIEKTADVARDVLLDELDGTLSVAEVVPTLVRVRGRQPEAMVRAEVAAAKRIRDILADSYTEGSRITMGEAERQGLKLGSRNPLTPAAGEFLPVATALSMVPWTQTLSALQIALLLDQEFLSDPDPEDVAELAARRKVPTQTVAMVDAAATSAVGKAKDGAKQEVHVAHGKGRTRTAEKLKPSLIWASELLDSATCKPCAKMDGKEYKTMAGARRAYPNGPYKNCLGGNRCRGTLVFIFDEPEESWK